MVVRREVTRRTGRPTRTTAEAAEAARLQAEAEAAENAVVVQSEDAEEL